jgi:hypothetical protein
VNLTPIADLAAGLKTGRANSRLLQTAAKP